MSDPSIAIFQTYVLSLRETPLDQQTEHSSRGALKALLDHFKPAKAIVTHEPKRAQDKGSPDFKVAQAGQIIGYVENKAVGDNLDAVLKSAQIKKYQALSPNLLITDYLRWVWLKDGKVLADVRLGEAGLLEDRKAQLRPERVTEVEALLRNFFSQPPQGIARAKALAEALAVRTQLLRDYLGEELVRQREASEGGQLIGLFGAFEKQVSHEITLEEFADAFAQTLSYGLFLAKLNDAQNDTITLANAKTFIPQSVGLIRELVGFLDNLNRAEYADVRWVVEEVLSIINGLDVAAVQEDLSFGNRKAKRGTRAGSDEEWRLFSRDPFIYFYEDFLEIYDKSIKTKRGVYYTPPPIVNFIVRAVDDILRSSFGIEQGLADRKRVTVLDFACGTGTFLVEVLERIFEVVPPTSGKAQSLVTEHVLKNIYGFEYLIAPYTIAHLKLGQYLAEKGLTLGDDERFQVYLTNTLEPIEPQMNHFVPELSRETERAQAVKERPILVITGNPPYAGHSKNPSTRLVPYESLTVDVIKRGDFKTRTIKTPLGKVKMAEFKTEIGAAIEKYKLGPDEIEKPRQAKWLQNDYVKFIRFAQSKMDAAEEGIVAVITANSFLDGQTYARMRYSLAQTFDQIHLIDLHGSTDRLEITPTGEPDQNVFDISTGVSIGIFVKKRGLEKGVFHTDWWGKRQEKYARAFSSEIGKLKSESLAPKAPQFLFVPNAETGSSEFQGWHSVDDIFSPSGKPAPGFVSLHDDFAISFDEKETVGKVERLLKTASLEDARRAFKLCKTDQWSYENAKIVLASLKLDTMSERVTYRPFDERWTIWNSSVAVHLRERANNHLLADNIALLTSRATKGETFAHSLVTDKPTEAISLSSKTSNNAYVFPLYLYPPPEGSRKPKAMDDLFGADHDPFAGKDRIENIAPAFRRWLEARYGVESPSSEGEGHITPEAILGYIYAVLHAPTYRRIYADFLRTDFPRIPFPEKRADFDALSALGQELVQAHLMKAVPKRGLGAYTGKGSDSVGKPRYDATTQRLHINDDKHFANVPSAVWDFTIGGYQVIDKYLKSRKGRTLSLDEQENVENIVNVLDFTIAQMGRIDAVYASAKF